MTKTELIAEMSKKADVTKKTAAEVLGAFTETVKEALCSGQTVTLVGFGTFYPSKMSERKVRNPRTGKEMDVPSRVVPKFRAGKELKEALR